jgi:prevent-host-death family protein
MCYHVHMDTVNIRALHIKTGDMVRKAGKGYRVVITDRGKPVAALVPYKEEDFGVSFNERETLPDFDSLPEVSSDSTAFISEDRAR